MKYQFDPFSVEYDSISSPIEDFKTECIAATQKAILMNPNEGLFYSKRALVYARLENFQV